MMGTLMSYSAIKTDDRTPKSSNSQISCALYSDKYLTMHLFQRAIHFPGQQVTYLQNPKVACTSIETSLWAAYEPGNVPSNVHREKQIRRESFFYLRNLTNAQCKELLNSEFFTVVRNPYARFLSAYLNKVQNEKPWARIHKHCGFQSLVKPSISELLERFKDLDLAGIDHHFRPQHINLLVGFAPLSVTGHMEHFSEIVTYLSKKDIRIETKDKHATNAAEQVRSRLSDREIDLIREIYKDDFTNFGYSFDIERQNPERTFTIRKADTGPLAAFLKRATKS